MSSPILAWALALSRDGERADCSPSAGGGKGLLAPRGARGLQDPAWLGGKAGEEHGTGRVWVVASKQTRREKCSKSFGCFSLPSPPSPAGEECREGSEGSARKVQHIFKCFSHPLSSVLHSQRPPNHPSCGSCSWRGGTGTPRLPPVPFSLEQQHFPLPLRHRWWVKMHDLLQWAPAPAWPSCRRGAALLQTWGTKERPFRFSAPVGCLQAGFTGGYKAPPNPPDARDAACPSAASGFCRAGRALTLGAGGDDPWRLGPHGVGGGCVAPCKASSVLPSSAQPVGVSSAGAAAASHHLFLQRHLPRGSVLAEVTSPPSRPVHHAGRWDEVTVKLLREVSINTVLGNIMVCGNLFVIVY